MLPLTANPLLLRGRFEGYEHVDIASPSGKASIDGRWVGDKSVKDYIRRGVTITQNGVDCPAFVISGSFDGGGRVRGILCKMLPQTGEVVDGRGVYRFLGHWSTREHKHWQAMDFRWLCDRITGHVTDVKKNRNLAGAKLTSDHEPTYNIVDIAVLVGSEPAPAGFELITRSVTIKYSGNIAATATEEPIRLAVRRSHSDTPIAEVAVLLEPGSLEALPRGWTLVDRTPAGHSANLNPGVPDGGLYIAFRRVSAKAEPTTQRLQSIAVLRAGDGEKLPRKFSKIDKTKGAMKASANLNRGTTGKSVRCAAVRFGCFCCMPVL